MKKIDWHYHRQALAHSYLKNVYQGSVGRIALLDVRRTGKTSFLLNDFFPEAINNGFIPIYVNLWLEPENPALAIISAIEKTLNVLKDSARSKLKSIANTEIKKIEVGNTLIGRIGVEFTKKNAVHPTQSQLLAINTGFANLAKQGDGKVVLIIDEIQHLATHKHFDNIQRSLRTALDTYIPKPLQDAGFSWN